MNHSFNIELAQKYGLNEAILIENMRFWILKNRANDANFHDGKTWTYNSIAAFKELFPYLPLRAIRTALDNLVSKKVLIKGNYNQKLTDRTTWYAFYDDSICPVRPLQLSGLTNPIAKNDKSTNTTDINTDINADNYIVERDVFAEAWAAYPKRPGANRTTSLKAWNARIAAGADAEQMLWGVRRYAGYVAAKRTEPEFIKQPATFFGPDQHFLSDWTVTVTTRQESSFMTANEKQKSFADRLTGNFKNEQPRPVIDIN